MSEGKLKWGFKQTELEDLSSHVTKELSFLSIWVLLHFIIPFSILNPFLHFIRHDLQQKLIHDAKILRQPPFGSIRYYLFVLYWESVSLVLKITSRPNRFTHQGDGKFVLLPAVPVHILKRNFLNISHTTKHKGSDQAFLPVYRHGRSEQETRSYISCDHGSLSWYSQHEHHSTVLDPPFPAH